MDFGEQLVFAFNFARNRERVGLFSLLILGALLVVGIFVALVIVLFGSAFGGVDGLRALVASRSYAALAGGLAFGAIAFLLLVFALWFVGSWIGGALMKNAGSERAARGGGTALSLRECVSFAKTRWWALFFASFVAWLVSFAFKLLFDLLQFGASLSVAYFFAVLLIMFVSFVVQMLLTWLFFFAQAEVVFGEAENAGGVSRAFGALKRSAELFFKKPLLVAVFWLLLAVAEIVLFIAALFPVVLFLALALAGALMLKGTVGIVLAALFGLIAFALLVAFVSFLSVFSLGYTAAAFLDLKAEVEGGESFAAQPVQDFSGPTPKPMRSAPKPRTRPRSNS